MTLCAGTFSIVAADPSTGEVGCAVQSKYLAIGAVTPWVRVGIGAVATQAMGVVARNGERALSALAANADPSEALDQALAGDADPDLRQLGTWVQDVLDERMVDGSGNLRETPYANGTPVLPNGLCNDPLTPPHSDPGQAAQWGLKAHSEPNDSATPPESCQLFDWRP